MALNQRIGLKKLLQYLEMRLMQCEQARENLITSMNERFGMRGPVEYPPGGKKRVRQNFYNRITEMEGSIKELQLLISYLQS